MTPDQQRLLAITASHIKLLTELETILRGESDALSRRQLQDLQAATERKQELLNRLEAAGHELFQLCQEAGVQPARSGLQGAGVTAAMAHAWTRMCLLLERCREQNRINGSAIEASRTFAENLLALLRGQQAPAKTYGRRGKLYRDPSAHELGSA